MKRAASGLLALCLAGCAVGPDYSRPNFAAPAQYSEMPQAKSEAPLSTPLPADGDLARWWTQFHDAELESLVRRALASNLDLKNAALRVREAREQEIEAGAAGLPQLNASSYDVKLHANSNLLSRLGAGGAQSASQASGAESAAGAAPASPAGMPTDIELYSLGFDASWELDVFGGVRRSVEAANDTRQADIWAMRDGEVTLTAEVATNYLALRALQARIALLNDEARRQDDTLGLIRARRMAGLVTELDVNQQVALKASTVAELPQLKAQAGAAEHAIAVLLADDPGALKSELERAAAPPVIPTTVPVGLPSTLLERRPDIREAERSLAAATAQIGVAVADLYPKFDLTGGPSFASNHPGTVFRGPNFSVYGLASISWPIFHWGAINANIDASKAQAEATYLMYRKAILVALQNVDGALLRYDSDQQRLLSLEQAATAARSSANIAVDQYRVGLTPYINVLTAQATDLADEDALEQGREAVSTDLVSLYKALGGGWTNA